MTFCMVHPGSIIHVQRSRILCSSSEYLRSDCFLSTLYPLSANSLATSVTNKAATWKLEQLEVFSATQSRYRQELNGVVGTWHHCHSAASKWTVLIHTTESLTATYPSLKSLGGTLAILALMEAESLRVEEFCRNISNPFPFPTQLQFLSPHFQEPWVTGKSHNTQIPLKLKAQRKEHSPIS